MPERLSPRREASRLACVGAALSIMLAIASPLPALGGNAAEGERLARRLCAGCHAIGRHDRGPHGEAPPFRVLMQRYRAADLEEALAEGITVGHPDMPIFTLTPRQIADMVAHLRTLERRP